MALMPVLPFYVRGAGGTGRRMWTWWMRMEEQDTHKRIAGIARRWLLSFFGGAVRIGPAIDQPTNPVSMTKECSTLSIVQDY